MLTCATNINKELIFVCDRLVEQVSLLDDVIDGETVGGEYSKFCDYSIDEACKIFSTHFGAVVLDLDIDISELACTKNNHKYVRVKSLKLLIKDIRTLISQQNLKESLSTQKLKQIFSTVKTDCLHESYDKLFKAFQNDEINEIFMLDQTLKKHMNPVSAGTHYLNPKVREKTFESSGIGDARFFGLQYFRFGSHVLPDKARAEFGNYQLKPNNFEFNFLDVDKKTVVQFWEDAQIGNPNLATFAVQMLSIPAIPKSVDMKCMYEIREIIRQTMRTTLILCF